MNQFADRTDEELHRIYLNLIPEDQKLHHEFPELSSQQLHSSGDIDWVAEKKVTPIKNQGRCGSCWAFAAIGAIESAILQKQPNKNKNKFDLSEQQQVDCVKEDDDGCEGGWMKRTYKYAMNYGVETEKKYPYKAKYSGRCLKKGGKWKIKDYQRIDDNFDDVLAALKHQPLSVAVDATNWFFNDDEIVPYGDERKINHGVILVGYFNGGCNSESKPYWRIKNSWGNGWADNGYANLAIGRDGNTFGILKYPEQPLF